MVGQGACHSPPLLAAWAAMEDVDDQRPVGVVLTKMLTTPKASTTPRTRNPRYAGFLDGRCRARTSDLLGVNQALSQLS